MSRWHAEQNKLMGEWIKWFQPDKKLSFESPVFRCKVDVRIISSRGGNESTVSEKDGDWYIYL